MMPLWKRKRNCTRALSRSTALRRNARICGHAANAIETGRQLDSASEGNFHSGRRRRRSRSRTLESRPAASTVLWRHMHDRLRRGERLRDGTPRRRLSPTSVPTLSSYMQPTPRTGVRGNAGTSCVRCAVQRFVCGRAFSVREFRGFRIATRCRARMRGAAVCDSVGHRTTYVHPETWRRG